MVVPLNESVEFIDDTCPRVEEETFEQNKTTVHKELYDWSEYTQVRFSIAFKKFLISLYCIQMYKMLQHRFSINNELTYEMCRVLYCRLFIGDT